MLRIIMPERMRAAELAFMARTGTPGIDLMERAARAVTDVLLSMAGSGGALFLCGPGNNGGDGYAAARLFAQTGRSAWVWTPASPEMLRGDARTNMERCTALKIPVRRIFAMPDAPPEGCSVVVDALFGTGQDRPLSGIYAEVAAWINACGLPVLSVDTPSGTAVLMVRADKTVTFHCMKPSHLLFPGRVCSGNITVCDIGIPQEPYPDDFELLQEADIPRLLPPRPLDAHKGTCGHALVVAGSLGMAGAAALCAGAALRGGAGLVTAVCPGDVLPILQTLVPCALCIPTERLGDALPGKTALAAGPGLGRSKEAGEVLQALLRADIPQVWDADALNWLAENPARLDGRFVLTPHPGEAARLLDCAASEIVADPVGAAESLHVRYGAVALLKGATTVICGQGRRALNTTGTPGMATGGSGDVLTGLIAALLSQGLSPIDAALVGAFLHGRAGEAAVLSRGVRSMTAEDLLTFLRID